MEQLVGIDAHRGHSHAASLHRDRLALILSGIAEHTADLIVADRIAQIGLCQQLGAQRVTGHQDCLGNLSVLCVIVRGWNIGHKNTLSLVSFPHIEQWGGYPYYTPKRQKRKASALAEGTMQDEQIIKFRKELEQAGRIR